MPRDKNTQFMSQYDLNKSKAKCMLLALTADDIQYQMEDIEYTKFGTEPLIVFKKEYTLTNLFGNNVNQVIYIKIKYKEDNLPIISFHQND